MKTLTSALDQLNYLIKSILNITSYKVSNFYCEFVQTDLQPAMHFDKAKPTK